VLAAAIRRGVFLFADSAFLAFDGTRAGEFFPLVQFNTNSFLAWRFEPMFHMLLRPLGFSTYAVLLFFFVCGGIAASIREYAQCGPLRSSLLAVSASSLLLFWFGIDLIIWSFVAALSWQLFFFARFGKPGRNGGDLIIFLSTVAAAGFANSLILLTTGIAVLVHLKKNAPRSLVPSLVAAFIYSLCLPSPSFPAYAAPGHLVPYYGVVDGLQPLFGDGPPMLHIDRAFLRSAFAAPGLWLVVTAISMLLLTAKSDRERGGSREFALMAVFLAVSVALDTAVVSGDVSQISPVQTAARLLPGLFFIALTPLALTAGVVLACGAAGETSIASLVMLFALGCPLLWHSELTNAKDGALWEKVAAIPDAKERARVTKILQSPSYWLIREYGLSSAEPQRILKPESFVSAQTLPVHYAASVGEGKLSLIADARDTTAWSTAGGAQRGGEWVNFVFDAPVSPAGIRLETGRYFTDFPRGVEIRTATDCSVEDRTFEQYRVVYSSRDNQGEILYTADGYPYFSEQYTFAYTFPARTTAKCILVRQTGTDSHFDWSISEVYFALD